MTLRHHATSSVSVRAMAAAMGVMLGAAVPARAQQPQPPPPPASSQAPAATPAASPAPAAGQTPPPAPAAPQSAPGKAAAPPSLSFTGDAGFVIFTVRAEGAPDFEAFFAKVKEALAKGTRPEYKDMAAGWKLFKVADAPQSGQILYASVIEPAVKGADYDPVKILGEVFPADATALYPKLMAALVGVNRLNLQTALKMGG